MRSWWSPGLPFSPASDPLPLGNHFLSQPVNYADSLGQSMSLEELMLH